MGHPWEGTVHQHTAIWTDHRRRTARPARDSTAITSLGVPCHRGKIPVRPARSRYRPDGSRRRTQEKLQKRRKAKQQGTGFWATPQGRRIAAPREEEPVRNRSQTWQDRDGVWHNWRTPEPASESDLAPDGARLAARSPLQLAGLAL